VTLLDQDPWSSSSIYTIPCDSLTFYNSIGDASLVVIIMSMHQPITCLACLQVVIISLIEEVAKKTMCDSFMWVASLVIVAVWLFESLIFVSLLLLGLC
jgi:hypothetical protein